MTMVQEMNADAVSNALSEALDDAVADAATTEEASAAAAAAVWKHSPPPKSREEYQRVAARAQEAFAQARHEKATELHAQRVAAERRAVQG